jgi:hypothetical protein
MLTASLIASVGFGLAESGINHTSRNIAGKPQYRPDVSSTPPCVLIATLGQVAFQRQALINAAG